MRYEKFTVEGGKEFIALYIDDDNVRIFEVDENNPEYSYFAEKLLGSEK